MLESFERGAEQTDRDIDCKLVSKNISKVK